VDRDNQVIYSHQDYIESTNINSITAFPWLDTIEMETKRPYTLLKPLNNKEKVIDERIAYLVKDILKEHMKRGSAGRRSALLKRDDIYGKTGTTNDSISTWFSGFHEDLVTTVWVGTDDFSSLGKNEYGSSIALPIWVDYMSDQLEDLEIKGNSIPEKISFIKVNPDTGKPNDGDDINGYFELFLDENIQN
jgi:penicillin-binding protein 1A